jgi:1-acyl-sn-glycerol-3-phosphate acyltransferase
MSGIQNIITLAWGIWFHFWLVLLTVIGGLLTILFSFSGSGGPRIQQVGRWWARILLFLAQVQVEVEGVERLEAGQTYVFAANHRSNFDIFVLYAVLPGRFLWVAKKSLFKIPLFGQAISRMGCVPVDRDNLQEAVRSLNHAASMLQGGTSMIIFPEGTRGTSPELLPFKKGVFIMALKAGQPIVPVAISGTRFIQPRGSLQVRPGKVRVVVSSPIYPQGFKHKEDLMAAVYEAIAAHYDPNFPYGSGTH